MDDLHALLATMPPGADLFDYLSATIDQMVYPDLGQAFYIQCYVVTALCGIVAILLVAGLIIRWRKRRLNFFVIDGSATRPNPKVFVPILWCITAGLIILHTFCIRKAMQSKFLPPPLGVFWWMVMSGIHCSYAIISTSAMCRAPIIRKGLSQLDRHHKSFGGFAPSFIVLHGLLLLTCAASVGTTYIYGRITAIAFKYHNEGYVAAQRVLAEAKALQSSVVLSGLPSATAILLKALDYDHHAKVVGGAINTGFIVVYFLTGLIPALFLKLYMRKRIVRLQQHDHPYSTQSESSHARSIIHIFAQQGPRALSGRGEDVVRVELSDAKPKESMPSPVLPKDRPFTNLASSSEVPPTYAAILEADVNPREKALRLKAALRRDNIQLIAYFLMLASLWSLTLFQLCGGAWNYSAKDVILNIYSWEAWSYLLPAIILACSALHDAIYNSNDDNATTDFQVSSFSRKSTAPPASSIQLSQTVEVVEEYQMEFNKVEWKQRSIGDSHDC